VNVTSEALSMLMRAPSTTPPVRGLKMRPSIDPVARPSAAASPVAASTRAKRAASRWSERGQKGVARGFMVVSGVAVGEAGELLVATEGRIKGVA
jgi:hypothetical protein